MTEAAPTRRPRRSQAERTAETRGRIIQAAISCLDKAGYSATTITTVADEAGVSRGAVTHQFPVKTDLMLAVVQWVFDNDADLYERSIVDSDPRRWLAEMPELMWSVISRPSGTAVTEIMLASRSIPELAEQLRVLQKQIARQAHQWSAERVKAAGLVSHPDGAALHELYVAAVRGLAVQATCMDDRDGVHRSLRLLSQMMRQFYPELAQSMEEK